MALNLRQKMPASHTLIVHDVNDQAIEGFVKEVEDFTKSKGTSAGTMKLETARNAREAAEKSVSHIYQSCNQVCLGC